MWRRKTNSYQETMKVLLLLSWRRKENRNCICPKISNSSERKENLLPKEDKRFFKQATMEKQRFFSKKAMRVHVCFGAGYFSFIPCREEEDSKNEERELKAKLPNFF